MRISDWSSDVCSSDFVRDTVRKVDAIRATVGNDVDLMVDLHGPPWLTVQDAIVLGRALEPYQLLFIEDPTAPENLERYGGIRDALVTTLAAGAWQRKRHASGTRVWACVDRGGARSLNEQTKK